MAKNLLLRIAFECEVLCLRVFGLETAGFCIVRILSQIRRAAGLEDRLTPGIERKAKKAETKPLNWRKGIKTIFKSLRNTLKLPEQMDKEIGLQ